MNDFSHSASEDLVRALKLSDEGDVHWDDQDRAAILSHQLEAPLVEEIAGCLGIPTDHPALAGVVVEGMPIRSFRDLLLHPQPPRSLLMLAKEFAKVSGTRPTGALPHDVAKVLYLAVIWTAGKHGHKISGLDENSLRTGVKWAAELNWLDAQMRQVLQG